MDLAWTDGTASPVCLAGRVRRIKEQTPQHHPGERPASRQRKGGLGPRPAGPPSWSRNRLPRGVADSSEAPLQLPRSLQLIPETGGMNGEPCRLRPTGPSARRFSPITLNDSIGQSSNPIVRIATDKCWHPRVPKRNDRPASMTPSGSCFKWIAVKRPVAGGRTLGPAQRAHLVLLTTRPLTITEVRTLMNVESSPGDIVRRSTHGSRNLLGRGTTRPDQNRPYEYCELFVVEVALLQPDVHLEVRHTCILPSGVGLGPRAGFLGQSKASKRIGRFSSLVDVEFHLVERGTASAFVGGGLSRSSVHGAVTNLRQGVEEQRLGIGWASVPSPSGAGRCRSSLPIPASETGWRFSSIAMVPLGVEVHGPGHHPAQSDVVGDDFAVVPPVDVDRLAPLVGLDELEIEARRPASGPSWS